ncbi:MAG TPA: sodium/solute symporter [Longimicrobiales bacterium]|nr:sodium/solute symporter [Longimicrobiales bacterium]
MSASAVIIGILVAYLLILLAIGVWGGRESGDVKGYYVAGKNLPSWVIAFSSNSTGESAWLLLGLTGMGYMVGIHAFWVVFGEVLGVTLAWVFVARPFKAYTDRFDSVTVPDFLEDRFRDGTHVLRLVSAFIILSMTAAYTAAQLTASGKAFNAFLGTSYGAGVLIGAAIILFYTTVGGFKAVAYSDLLQGLLMFACLLLLPIVGIAAAGGWTEMLTTVRAEDPTLLEPLGGLGFTPVGIASVAGFIAIGVAFLGSPQLLTRFISARDTRQITNGSLIAVICIIVFDVGAVLAGLAGRAVFPGLADPETIYPIMGAQLFPAALTGIFLVVVLAAMMSTTDSLLILASSAVVRDVIQKVLRPDLSQLQLSRFGKATTVVLGMGAIFMALAEVRMIFWFVLFAWSGLACAFTPVVLCALFWKRTTRAGAIAGMIAGFVVTVGWVLLFKTEFYELYEMIPGFLAGLAFTVGVSLMTAPPVGAAEENDEVRREVGPPFRPVAAVPKHGGAMGSGREVVLRAVLALAVAGVPLLAGAGEATAQRARDLGIPFDGTPGPLNAITDVAGVSVGHTTLISGSGPLVVGQGPVRTGVTALLPRGHASAAPVFAAYHSLNGNGEMTGAAWIEESGTLEGPLFITNTHSVGVVRDAAIRWFVEHRPGFMWALPVVAETWDGVMNDINGFHVRPEHVFEALAAAAGGPVTEGAVGGGTGMSCNGFKGGIGTASRRLPGAQGGHTVGVLVQCNYGTQAGLLLAGVPVGRELAERGIVGRCRAGGEPTRAFLRSLPPCDAPGGTPDSDEHGSIIIVVATDAPLLPHQLERLIMRATLGLGRAGSIASNFSGDLFVAFSTANTGLDAAGPEVSVRMLPNDRIDALFRATVEATEEAIANAMVAAETMTGADDIRMNALPHDAVREILRRHGRLRGD